MAEEVAPEMAVGLSASVEAAPEGDVPDASSEHSAPPLQDGVAEPPFPWDREVFDFNAVPLERPKGVEVRPTGGEIHPGRIEMAYGSSTGLFDAQKQRALDAKRRANALQRNLTKERGRDAIADVTAKKKAAGKSVRAAATSGLERVLRGHQPASDEEVTALSVTLNTRMRELFEVPSWIKLFRAINTVRARAAAAPRPVCDLSASSHPAPMSWVSWVPPVPGPFATPRPPPHPGL